MELVESVTTVDESTEKEIEQPLIQLENMDTTRVSEDKEIQAAQEQGERVGGLHPFRRWVNSFRVKKTSSMFQPQRYVEGWIDVPTDSDIYNDSPEQKWEQLSHNSSHLGTVKTTTMSITSQSLVRSRRTTHSTTNRSIKSEFRGSIDSLRPPLNLLIDEEAQNRAIKRRQVLQEIITTESDYVFGLKALTDVILVLLIFSTRPEIYHNIQRIRESHEDFLGRVRIVTPMSTLSGREVERLMSHVMKKHPGTGGLGFKALQNRSLRTRTFKATMNYHLKELAAEANEALEVAREIGKLSTSFTAYKEFCDNYELLTQDATVLRQSVPNWPIFEQGIEALAKSAASIENKAQYENKSLYLNDLLVKPAQRLCKYPLLLQELLKWTHIQDDPSAHDEISRILENVCKALDGVNEATATTIKKSLVEKTFFLQEMLEFSESNASLDLYRQLGPITLCGVLHVTYQEARHITGAYMVCALFKNHFFLAEMKDESRKLLPVACLYIDDVKIDTLSNGKGIECFCLFSWKLIFQHDDDKFEFVLSASSSIEERRWKTRILKSAAGLADVHTPVSPELRENTFMYLDITPLECGSKITPQLLRRPSVHSLGISLSRSDLQQVIIRKTHCPYKHGQTHPVEGEIERPKIPSFNSAIILTTRRHDRISLERAIAPIYSREVLPYPGMHLAKGDLIFGSSSIMRRLSLRHKRYQRCTSVNLPTAVNNSNDTGSKHTVDGKPHGPRNKTRRAGSESCLGCNDEKTFILQGDDLSLKLDRSKTEKGRRSSSKKSLYSHPQLATKTDKDPEQAESITLKAIWSMLGSMTLRKSRKNTRPTLSGV